MNDDLGNTVENLYQSFRTIKRFAETSDEQSTIEYFMKYSVEQAKGRNPFGHFEDREAIRKQLDKIYNAYIIVKHHYDTPSKPE